MLERQIQQKVLHYCKSNAIICRKVDSSSARGWPDLIVILQNGTVLFVELKTLTGKLSALQARTIKQIKNNNGNVYVIRSLEEFIRTVESHG